MKDIKKAIKERDDAKDEADDAQRSAITMFNEQKRHETHMGRMKDDIYRANIAVDKMRDESVRHCCGQDEGRIRPSLQQD
jgi:uncharacterized coiled-coil DUF342 family protein